MGFSFSSCKCNPQCCGSLNICQSANPNDINNIDSNPETQRTNDIQIKQNNYVRLTNNKFKESKLFCVNQDDVNNNNSNNINININFSESNGQD